MFELYTGGPFAIDPTDPRNQFHERALLEARIAHDYVEHTAPDSIAAPGNGPSLVSRLRFALAGAAPVVTTTEVCTCQA
jgi:hypothetical protein